MLEKILEEIDKELMGSMGKKREGLLLADEIIRKNINDGWIPCEERLPDESGHYRVTVRDTELGDITEETAWFAHVDDYDMNKSEWRELYEYTEVIAWRELDPYRPEKGAEIETKQNGTRKED